MNKFKQPSSDWLSEELNQPLFSDTKFKEIKDFSLDMSADPKKAFLTEAENAIRVYSNLKFLTDSQASDERLWAGLCLGQRISGKRTTSSLLSEKEVIFYCTNSTLLVDSPTVLNIR